MIPSTTFIPTHDWPGLMSVGHDRAMAVAKNLRKARVRLLQRVASSLTQESTPMDPFNPYTKKIGKSRKSGLLWFAYHPKDVLPMVAALRSAGGKLAKEFRRKQCGKISRSHP